MCWVLHNSEIEGVIYEENVTSSTLFFYGVIVLLMVVMVHGFWGDQQTFSTSEKEKTTATIQVDEHKVKTYNFPENDYGVEASKSAWRDGDEVTIYYLKDQPDVVAENPYTYHSKSEIFSPLFTILIFLLLIAIDIFVRYVMHRLV
ncbi:hypothetical protein IGI37_000647 [Enterococcus sp. AZ194]|uniref:hypothetical protein n=1 Tax=Enterococcus sp. AZ194 TaxID=2774629 RepID=UPI003F2624B3